MTIRNRYDVLTTCLVAILFAGTMARDAAGQTVYVDADAVGTNDGSSWENAFTLLQDGLQTAELGLATDVWVATGIYTPGETQQSTFTIVDGVTVVGGFSGGETSLGERVPNFHAVNPTILDGDWDDNKAAALFDSTAVYTVVTINGTDAVLDGFIVQGGYDSRPLSAINANGVGGGVKIDGGSTSGLHATVRNSVIRNNSSTGHGAGIVGVNANYTLVNVLITDNGGGPDPRYIVAAAGARSGLLAVDASYDIRYSNVTIAGNGGQAFFDSEANASVKLTMENSIMYNNGLTLPMNSPTFQETIATFTNVIFEQSTSYCSLISCENVIDTDPNLRTTDGFFSLMPGSIALDFGDAALLMADSGDLDGDGDVDEPTPLDGASRPRVQGTALDAGAFEGDYAVVNNVGFDSAFEPTERGIRLTGFPNPFRGEATVVITTSDAASVDLVLYDVIGREVRRLFEGVVAAGEPTRVRLDGSGLAPGVYFVRAGDGSFAKTVTLSLVK